MNTRFSGIFAGIAAVLAATSASATPRADDGHYAWRSGIQASGPRAPLATSHRVWVPAATATTDTCPPGMAAKSGIVASCVSQIS